MLKTNMTRQSNPVTIREKEQFCVQIDTCKLNMFRLAKSILHNDLDAEEAVSEAILKGYSSLSSLKSFESFKPWMMKITINEAYKLSNMRKKVIYLENMEIPEQTMTDDTGTLWSVVNTLEKEFRTVAVLFYYEDMSIKDISRILELPQGTVKSRLSRARQKLKELLSDEGSM